MPAQKFVDKHSLKILNMEPATIPPNNSHQHLMTECDNKETNRGVISNSITKKQWITVVILCFVNLINYMDRYTVAGILTDVKDHYGIGDEKAGLLQTAFVISYMLFAPIFGYLGDRFSRRYIMAFGVFLWGITTLLGSFMPEYFSFLVFRSLVGIGEASYSTIAPTIISDLFVEDVRSKMLALFYFAIPVGSGLGYIVGSETAKLAGSWQWGLRITPILGGIAVLLILFVLIDPERGEAEGKSHVAATSFKEDIRLLLKNKSFMLSTGGFTCVAFVAGALAWWGPHFILKGLVLQPGHENDKITDVSFKFGAIAMVAGLVGVLLGSAVAQRLRRRHSRADPLICAAGLIISAPLLFAGALEANSSPAFCYTFIFFGQVALNLNWAIVADILLYVVAPNRRSTAEAFQILISHAFGDAGSPYLIGVVTETLKQAMSNNDPSSHYPNEVSPDVEFYSMQYSLFITSFVEVLGGLFFLLTAVYILSDKDKAEREVTGVDNPGLPTHLYADDPQLTRSEVNLTVS